jgi:hypothetical protein
MSLKMKNTQIYMLLSAVGLERGQPFAFFTDPFKARQYFEAVDGTASAFTGAYTAFLVAYNTTADGQLVEVEELGRK